MPRRHPPRPPPPEPVAPGGDRARACGTKTAYPSRTEAQDRADEFGLGTGDPKGVYRCPHCDAWHIGGPRRG